MTAGTLRPIEPIIIPHIHQETMVGACPTFEHVDPKSLWVDEGYQRNLSERSIRLLRKIISAWDWRKFKPPVCEIIYREGVRQLHVIDGQHTAIGAATRDDISIIPVIVNDGTSKVEDRARAFIGHNADRIAVTANQIFYAELAAKDEVAVRIQRLCQETGITILKAPKVRYEAGDTVALATLRNFAKSMSDGQIMAVMEILAASEFRPIPSDAFKAVRALLWDPWYEIPAHVLRLVVKNRGTDVLSEARLMKARRQHKSVHVALADIYLRECNAVLGTNQKLGTMR